MRGRSARTQERNRIRAGIGTKRVEAGTASRCRRARALNVYGTIPVVYLTMATLVVQLRRRPGTGAILASASSTPFTLTFPVYLLPSHHCHTLAFDALASYTTPGSYYVVVPHGRTLTPAIDALIRWLRED